MLDLPPPDPSLEIVIASRGYSKGIAQAGGAQLVGRGEVALGLLFAGVQLKNVDTQGADAEAAWQAGVRGRAAGFDLHAGIAYKLLLGRHGPVDRDTYEFTASASRAFGRLTPRIGLTFSFDDLGATRRALFAEAGAAYRVGAGTRLEVALGRRERGGGGDYTSFNAGLSQTLGRHITAELHYYDTAESRFGAAYRGRLVAALRFRF